MKPKSVSAFKATITKALKPARGEAAAKITAPEMKAALAQLPATKAGVKAATDLLDKSATADAPMHKAAKDALKRFIDDAVATTAGPIPEAHPGMIKIRADEPTDTPQGPRAGSARELKMVFQQVPAALDKLFADTFPRRSRSESAALDTVRMRADGNFDVTLQLVHWQTRDMREEQTIVVDPFGKQVQAQAEDPIRKIRADEPIGGRTGGWRDHVLKIQADEPVSSGGGGRGDDNIRKVRADDPTPSDDGIRKVRADEPIGRTGDWRDRVLKITADEPN